MHSLPKSDFGRFAAVCNFPALDFERRFHPKESKLGNENPQEPLNEPGDRSNDAFAGAA
jgi:hypothetical protein